VNLGGAAGLNFASLSSGGTTTLNAPGGAILVTTDLQSAGNVTATGRSIDINSFADLSFANAQASAGDLHVASTGNLTFAQASATGAIGLSGDIVTATGPVTAGGAVNIMASGGLTFGSLTSGGTTHLSAANGLISVGSLTSAGAVSATGRGISIASPGALTFDSATATAGGLSIQALGLIATGLLSATGDVALNGLNGLTLASVTSGGLTSLHADNGAVAATDLRSAGLVDVFGRSITVASGAGLTVDNAVASAGNLAITTQLGLTANRASATGSVALRSLGGAIHAAGNVDGGAISLIASGNVQADGNVTATGLIGVTSGGTFGLGGTARGTSIGVTSQDIQLAGGSKLGVRGTTQDITLTNGAATNVSHIGGASGAGGYDLDAAEAARLFADNSITLAAGGNVVVGTLQLSYGGTGNIGTGGSLEITTPGSVEVSGAVDLTTSSAGDTFTIDPTRIDVIAGEGSIAMLSAGAAPQGTMNLTAGTVAIVSRTTRNAIAGLADLAQISSLLDTPAPAGPAGGYLQAGTIGVNAQNAFFVQNGGAGTAFPDRRGFTANALNITTGSANTQIAINGVIVQNGTPVTGLSTVPLVTINGIAAAAGGQFDPKSTINGCVIGSDCRIPDAVPVPSNDDLTPPVSPDNSGQGGLSGTLVQLEDNKPLIAPPLVDEPITGVGNDDLWVPQCVDPKQEGCPQQDATK
jgi:hypothetical protein